MAGSCMRHCIYCRQDKPWIASGKKLKDGSKIYVNEASVRWAGRRCPECERARVQAAVRCDSFEKELVPRQLEDAGYELVNKSFPFKVSKDGKLFSVGLRHAFTKGQEIKLDQVQDPEVDLVAIVFNSVRICSAEQVQRLEQSALVHTAEKSKPQQKKSEPHDSL